MCGGHYPRAGGPGLLGNGFSTPTYSHHPPRPTPESPARAARFALSLSLSRVRARDVGKPWLLDMYSFELLLLLLAFGLIVARARKIDFRLLLGNIGCTGFLEFCLLGLFRIVGSFPIRAQGGLGVTRIRAGICNLRWGMEIQFGGAIVACDF